MRIKKGYVLREVAGSTVVVNVGGDLNFNGIIRLNETASFLWNLLEKEVNFEELLSTLITEYEIDTNTAKKDITQLILQLEDAGILE